MSLYKTGRANYLFDVAAQEVDGTTRILRFGSAEDIGASFTPVATAKVYRTPTSAVTLEILSDNAADDVSGVGARSVRITGTDENWERQTDTVSLDGTTAVTVPGNWLRVCEMDVATAGTYGSFAATTQAGTITLRESGGGDTWCEIPIDGGFGIGSAEVGICSAPAGERIFVYSHRISVTSSDTACVVLFVREGSDNTSAPFSPVKAFSVQHDVSGHLPVNNSVIGPFTGPCDIGFMARATNTTADVDVTFEIIREVI